MGAPVSPALHTSRHPSRAAPRCTVLHRVLQVLVSLDDPALDGLRQPRTAAPAAESAPQVLGPSPAAAAAAAGRGEADAEAEAEADTKGKAEAGADGMPSPAPTAQTVKVITVHSCSVRRLHPTLNH